MGVLGGGFDRRKAKGDLSKQVAGLLGSGIAAAIAYGTLTGAMNGGDPVNYKNER